MAQSNRNALLAVILLASFSASALGFCRRDTETTERLAKIVEANILAVHAFQTGLARTTGRGDAETYGGGGLSTRQLEMIVAHQKALLNVPASSLRSWVHCQMTDFTPATHLDPILNSGLKVPPGTPVEVFTRYLADRVLSAGITRSRPRARPQLFQLRAVANLYQTILEVDRDGDLLQQEFDLYIQLGLPVYLGQFGLPGSDEDFLATGRQLEHETSASPFATDAAAWQIAGRKVWNWGEKKLHIRDEQIVADELLKEPDIASLLPEMQKLAPRKIAVIGHSFTMGQHWSSPSSFVGFVTAMFAKINPKVQFRQFAAGGLTASRAYSNFYQDALNWKPDLVLLVVLMRSEADFGALRTMGAGFTTAGIATCVFDNLHDPESSNAEKNKLFQETARQAGMTIIAVDSVLANAPDRETFVCLDGIHMKEPYHRLMAHEWLRFILQQGSRQASLVAD